MDDQTFPIAGDIRTHLARAKGISKTEIEVIKELPAKV